MKEKWAEKQTRSKPISWAAVAYVLPLSSPWRCRCSQSRTTHWRLLSDSPASPSQTAHRCNSHTKHTLCLHITATMSHNWCTRYMLELSFRSLFIFLTLSLTWAAWRDWKLKATGDRCHCSYQVIHIKHSSIPTHNLLYLLQFRCHTDSALTLINIKLMILETA